jgi:hypothetical protein
VCELISTWPCVILHPPLHECAVHLPAGGNGTTPMGSMPGQLCCASCAAPLMSSS